MQPAIDGLVPLPDAESVADQTYDADGVDRTLIRWMLSLTPSERLDFLQSSLDMLSSSRPSHGPR